MSRTYSTHDGWTVMVRATDGQVHWTETGGEDPNPRICSFDYEEALGLAASLHAIAQEHREYVSLGVAITSGQNKYLRWAAEAAQMARMVDFAATTIAK